jgi:hypothetical protein
MPSRWQVPLGGDGRRLTSNASLTLRFIVSHYILHKIVNLCYAYQRGAISARLRAYANTAEANSGAGQPHREMT